MTASDVPAIDAASFEPSQNGWTIRESFNPLFEALGILWERRESGEHMLGMTCTPNLLNGFGAMHGGAIAALFDQALGISTQEFNVRYNGPEAPRISSVTIQLDVHFLASVKLNDFVTVKCRLNRQTRSLIFVDGIMTVGDHAVATGQAIFKIVRPQK